MSVMTVDVLAIGMETDCNVSAECWPLAKRLHEQLSSGPYAWPASILRLEDFDAYLNHHRTARKRAARAARLGYVFAEIERADYPDDIHAINTSKEMRQGRPMSAGYQTRQEFSPLPFYLCPRHSITTYGILKDDALVAYLVLYRSGDLVMVSQILGHADHLANDIMYLLVVEALRLTETPAIVSYNRWDSGQDGLRYFKSKLGFGPERVAWLA